MPGRIFLRRSSLRTCHLNLAVVGGKFWKGHLLFRDHLKVHPETAREHARLEHKLAVRFRCECESYTLYKAGFVEAVSERDGVVRPRCRPGVARCPKRPVFEIGPGIARRDFGRTIPRFATSGMRSPGGRATPGYSCRGPSCPSSGLSSACGSPGSPPYNRSSAPGNCRPRRTPHALRASLCRRGVS